MLKTQQLILVGFWKTHEMDRLNREEETGTCKVSSAFSFVENYSIKYDRVHGTFYPSAIV